MASPNEIAKASITVEANVDVAKASITDLRTDVEGLGVAADTTGAKMDSSFVSIGGSIKSATGAAQKFVGALTSTVGIATGLVAVVAILTTALIGLKSLFEKLSSGDGSAEKLAEKLDILSGSVSGMSEALKLPGFSAMVDKLKEATKEADRLQDILQRGSLVSADFEDRLNDAIEKEANLREQVNGFLRNQRDLKQQAADDEQRTADAAKQQAEDESKLIARLTERASIQKQLAEITENARISLIEDDEERDQAILNRQKKQLIAAAKAVGIEEGESDLQIAFELLDAVARAEKKKNIEIAKERERLDAERIEANTKKQIEGAIKAAEAFGDAASEALFGSTGSFTTRLDTILTEMRQISSNQGRR